MSDSLSGAVALIEARAKITGTSLRLPRDVTWDQTVNVAVFLGGIGRAYPFWIGDLLNDAEKIFGHDHAQLENVLPHSPQTLANYKSVAHKIPENRRRDGLSHSVHAAVAYLEEDKREELLDQAERNGWKRDDMRELVREAKAITTGDGTEVVPAQNDCCPTCGRPYEKE